MSAKLDALQRGPRTVHLYGHRGARGVFPENTMPGFRYAMDIGLAAVEVDVLASRDGVAVLTHNPRLWADTTCDRDGRWLAADGPLVCQLSFQALQGYDVGGIRPGTDYHARFPDQVRLRGTPIPSLEALCALIAPGSGFWLNIEVKSIADPHGQTPPPQDLVAAAVAPVQAHGLAKRTILQSFDWRAVHACREIAPEITRSYLSRLPRDDPSIGANIYPGSPWIDGCDLTAYSGSLPDAVADLGGAVWCPFFQDLTARDCARAHALGLLVNVWTVNEPEDLRRMVDLGVDGIITDFPARAKTVLSDLGMG